MSDTPRRTVRVDDRTWTAAQQRAAEDGRDLADVIRVALRAYAERRYDAIHSRRRR